MGMREKPVFLSPKTYVWVWMILIFLTGLTVSFAGMDWGRWGMVILLLVATIKSSLILNYFMHLRYEKKIRLFRWIIPGILLLLVLFIGFTFLDVVFR